MNPETGREARGVESQRYISSVGTPRRESMYWGDRQDPLPHTLSSSGAMSAGGCARGGVRPLPLDPSRRPAGRVVWGHLSGGYPSRVVSPPATRGKVVIPSVREGISRLHERGRYLVGYPIPRQTRPPGRRPHVAVIGPLAPLVDGRTVALAPRLVLTSAPRSGRIGVSPAALLLPV